MKIRKLIGWSLLAAVLLMIAGICIEKPFYWSIIDILVILICAISSFVLLFKKKQIE